MGRAGFGRPGNATDPRVLGVDVVAEGAIHSAQATLLEGIAAVEDGTEDTGRESL